MALPSLIGLCAEIVALGLVLSRYFGAPQAPLRFRRAGGAS